MAQPSGSSLIIASLRGGMNDTDPPSSIPEDMCVRADNVEFFNATFAERRAGCEPLDMTSSNLTSKIAVVHISQWFPTNQVTVPEYWALAATPGSAVIAAKNIFTAWTVQTPNDSIDTSIPDVYHIVSQSLNGKFFWAYHSAVDRLHVWTGSAWRRAGLAQPAAPTGANHGAGAYASTRYFRVRFIEKNLSGQILRRSEPSLSLTFTPSGAGDGTTVTMPALLSEGETHWELEASTDNATFYRIATTVVGTTTFIDTTAFATGYSGLGPLSEDIGTYLLQPSVKFLAVDGDRLLLGGHWTDITKQSTVYWTPVFADPGAGNDERLPLQIDNSINFDNFEGGALTGIASAVYGVWYAFKWGRIYQLTRTGDVTRAYEPITISTTRGAIPGSIVNGVDESGAPCIYFLDPKLGPSRIGNRGVQLISGLRGTWARINLLADIPAHGVYYPFKHQLHWWIAVDGASTPNLKIVLQITEVQSQGGDEAQRGWARADGRIAEAYCSAIFTENAFEHGNQVLQDRPFIGLTTPDGIQRCDVGTKDAGIAYNATVVTKPYFLVGILNKWGGMVGGFIATALSGASVIVRLIRDFGVENSAPVTVSLAPVGAETQVIPLLDNLRISEAKSIQIMISDS